MRKLRNRVRKMRVKCDWLVLDPLCETEANTWPNPEVKAEAVETEITILIKHLQNSFKPMCRSVAPAPQPVSKVQHNQVIWLQGDYFYSDS